MVSIIRSPAISDHKRKLGSRATAARSPQQPAGADVTEAQTGAASQLALESERQKAQAALAAQIKQQVEQARVAMREEFRKEAEAVHEAARQQGLQEGRASGALEAKQAVAAQLASLSAIAAQLQPALASAIRGTEEIAVAIAFEAICKILGKTMATEQGIQAAVRQAASHVLSSEQLVVRLHPDDLATLRAAGDLDSVSSSGIPLSWVADQSIGLGGCVLDTDGGELDARLETQLDRLRAALLAARGGRA